MGPIVLTTALLPPFWKSSSPADSVNPPLMFEVFCSVRLPPLIESVAKLVDSELAVSVPATNVTVSGVIDDPLITPSRPAVGTPALQFAAVLKSPLPAVHVVEVISPLPHPY